MRNLSYISDRYVFALEKRATNVPLEILSTERSLEVFPHGVRYHVSQSSAQCQNVKLLTKLRSGGRLDETSWQRERGIAWNASRHRTLLGHAAISRHVLGDCLQVTNQIYRYAESMALGVLETSVLAAIIAETAIGARNAILLQVSMTVACGNTLRTNPAVVSQIEIMVAWRRFHCN